jgi:hypothetical protein
MLVYCRYKCYKCSHTINVASRTARNYISLCIIIRGPFEKFVDWRQCATVMQRETVTVIPSCSGGVNVVEA